MVRVQAKLSLPRCIANCARTRLCIPRLLRSLRIESGLRQPPAARKWPHCGILTQFWVETSIGRVCNRLWIEIYNLNAEPQSFHQTDTNRVSHPVKSWYHWTLVMGWSMYTLVYKCQDYLRDLTYIVRKSWVDQNFGSLPGENLPEGNVNDLVVDFLRSLLFKK